MSDTDIAETDWRALAPASWDDDYRNLWIVLAKTNDRLARWQRDYRNACAENAALRASNAEMVEALRLCLYSRAPDSPGVAPPLFVTNARAALTRATKEPT